MFSFSCQNHSYVDINISARDLLLRYAHIYVSDMNICVDTSDQIHLPWASEHVWDLNIVIPISQIRKERFSEAVGSTQGFWARSG